MMQRPNFEFTVPMALEDYIPVFFTAVGLYFIAGFVSKKYPNLSLLAWLGAGLVVTDGFLKATWKLIYASTGTDVAWMKDSLFVLMGPGFIFVSWALFRGLKNEPSSSKQVWFAPLIIVFTSFILALVLAMTQPNRSWARVLLMLTTLGILFTNGQIIYDSLKRKLYLPIVLLAINIITIFGQAYLSQLPQTTYLHWVGQLNNTASWAAFALAIWLWKKNA